MVFNHEVDSIVYAELEGLLKFNYKSKIDEHRPPEKHDIGEFRGFLEYEPVGVGV